jgi:hypothetical protein
MKIHLKKRKNPRKKSRLQKKALISKKMKKNSNPIGLNQKENLQSKSFKNSLLISQKSTRDNSNKSGQRTPKTIIKTAKPSKKCKNWLAN